MFGSYKSTFYRWLAPFYGIEIAQSVNNLLSFEGQLLENFPI